ncbi:hypothetical protein IscW_ISCW003158, partial [Ixodes scapularis]
MHFDPLPPLRSPSHRHRIHLSSPTPKGIPGYTAEQGDGALTFIVHRLSLEGLVRKTWDNLLDLSLFLLVHSLASFKFSIT